MRTYSSPIITIRVQEQGTAQPTQLSSPPPQPLPQPLLRCPYVLWQPRMGPLYDGRLRGSRESCDAAVSRAAPLWCGGVICAPAC